MSNYDAWLEQPYQDACRREGAYEAALETKYNQLYTELLATPLRKLLEEYDLFVAPPSNLLAPNGVATWIKEHPRALSASTSWSLTKILDALVYDLAEHALENESLDCDGPDPDEFEPSDRDCSYWERTK